MPRLLPIVLLLAIPMCVLSQPKKLTAVKAAQAPKLDGKLDDAAWQNAPEATDFIINQPNFGKPSIRKTVVKLVYTDEAIYVGAYMYDDPKLIRRQLTQRDNEKFQDAENFGVAFDTYKDKQNAFQFIVTSANVQSDVRISATFQQSTDGGTTNNFGQPGFDYSWDAVWDSRTSIVEDGWIAELMIPYSALRFAKKDMQDWGVNFSRFIRRENETSYWNTVDPNASGFVNQFGNLDGLQNLQPPLRLSFLPYISTGYRDVPTNSGTIHNFLHSGGMDVKYGINESFTMDMTLIPDFGQVQSDNVILNLSPFEQQYAENRPFFTEGTEMYNKANIFYSRRVGGIPGKYFDALQLASDSGYKLLKNPSATQLYNATKFSGRTKGNLGIGVFNAVTAPMYAELQRPNGDILKMQTEPLANYNIIVLDQALKNRSYITFTNTNVLRSGGSRNANVSALDFSLYDKSNTYNFKAKVRYSDISGKDSAYTGYRAYTSFDKVSGIWQWGAYANITSEKYDPNDLGILRVPNDFEYGGYISFNQFTPNKYFNFRNYSININNSYLYSPFKHGETHISANFLHVFKNFWDANLIIESSPFWFNDFYELRTPGRVMKRTPWAFIGIRGSTDSRKKLYVSYFYGYANFSPIPDDPFYVISNGVRYRFSPKFSVDINAESQHDIGNFGAVLNSDGTPVIINDSSVMGRRQFTQFTTVINGIYNFKARMNLSVRLRHYWSKVRYTEMYDIKPDGYWNDRTFLPGHDANFNTFNLDMFYTWDFRLGSRLIIGWKNALGPDAAVDGSRYAKYISNFKNLFSIPHSNEFTVKFVYYIDYNDLHRKK